MSSLAGINPAHGPAGETVWFDLTERPRRSFSLEEPDPPAFSLKPESIAPNASALRGRQLEYGKSIGREGLEEKKLAGADPAREAAVDFVAMTLIQPILEQMREANAAAPPFAPTSAERQFGALADAQTARRIARASNFAIVDRIAQDLRRGASLPETPNQAPMPPAEVFSPALRASASPRRVDRVA